MPPSRREPGMGRSSRRWRRPGVGKSRLFFEFKATSSPAGWCWKRFRSRTAKRPPICRCSICCSSYFKIAGEDDERTRREKVDG